MKTKKRKRKIDKASEEAIQNGTDINVQQAYKKNTTLWVDK